MTSDSPKPGEGAQAPAAQGGGHSPTIPRPPAAQLTHSAQAGGVSVVPHRPAGPTTGGATLAASQASPVQGPQPPQAPRPAASRRKNRGTLVLALFSLGIILAGLLLTAGLSLSRRLPAARQITPTLATQPPPSQPGLTAVEVMQTAGPSVVSLVMYDTGGIAPTGSGSGVILSADGYIATNAHVIHGAGAIRVVLHNGRGYTATVIGADSKSDLAVLKVAATGLTPAVFGGSAGLLVGQQVYSIGNAAGSLPGSLTQGVVSGTQRNVPIATTTGQVVRMNLLQTDAAINPGNSGGALVNAWGQVIGICLGKIESAEVDNIGFAIPADTALPVLQALIDTGSLPAAAKLGVVCEALNETTGPPNGLPAEGLYISELTGGSSLHEAGVRPGDVLVQADGMPLRELADLLAVLQNHAPGDEIVLEVWLFHSGQTVPVTALLYGE